MRLITKREAARRATLSLRSLDRRFADGTGPAIIRIGPRRVGIDESDFEAWLVSLRSSAPGETSVTTRRRQGGVGAAGREVANSEQADTAK
jgi:predicted DNA-binding transcriptional regulator AlpA